MSVAIKAAEVHAEVAPSARAMRLWATLRSRWRRLLAISLFVLLVAVGSVWAVYTMQYYDDLDVQTQRQDPQYQNIEHQDLLHHGTQQIGDTGTRP